MTEDVMSRDQQIKFMSPRRHGKSFTADQQYLIFLLNKNNIDPEDAMVSLREYLKDQEVTKDD